MASIFSLGHRLRISCVLGVTAPALFALGQWAGAAEIPGPDVQAPAPAAAPAQSLSFDLSSCRRAALEKQPSIAAAAASLAAAQARAAGLERLRGIPLVTRDLPVRRQQSALGVAIAQAQVELTRQETLYNVTRTYWTAVYARQQLRAADDAIAGLRRRQKEVEELESWSKDMVGALVLAAEGRREVAAQGHKRALAALREAMGADDGFPCFDVADAELPRLGAVACGEEIVKLALARRGELVQASIFAEVTCHEVKAQATKMLTPTVKTFAAGSDVHARLVPEGSHGADYRPGGLAPEMPTFLVGPRSARVDQAKAYRARAETLVAKTRNLIALEARDAFLRWEEDSLKLPRYEAAAAAAQKASDRAAKDAKKPLDTNVSQADAINAGIVAAQLRFQANETLFQLVLDLAALERVTAGGFCAENGERK